MFQLRLLQEEVIYTPPPFSFFREETLRGGFVIKDGFGERKVLQTFYSKHQKHPFSSEELQPRRGHPDKHRLIFVPGDTSECTLVLVFVPGEHPPKPPFWKTTL